MNIRFWHMRTSSVQFTRLLCLMVLGFLSSGVRADIYAPVFTGTNGYVLLGTPGALQMGTNAPLTVEGWIKVRAFDATDILYSKNALRTSPYTHMFGVRTSGTVLSAYTGAGGSPANTWRDVTLPSALATSRWYHLAFSFDGATLSFYVDGVLKGTNTFSYVNTTSQTVKIGGYASGTDIAGMKSDVRVWNRARSEAEIRTFRYRRLSGRETGLIGYWPLNEGAGTNAYDATANASTGAILGASWTNVADLALQAPPAGFVYGSPFTLVNPKTASTRFTNTNSVDLAGVQVPAGYDRFQLTESGTFDPGGAWQSTSAIPSRFEFTQPASDTNVTLYAWFTNSASSVVLQRSEGGIIYTMTAPIPAVLASRTRELVPGYYARVSAGDVDNGTTGGLALGENMGVYQRLLNLVSGPDTNATPGGSNVTVSVLGDYSLTLAAVNEAGNIATSAAACTLTVVPGTGLYVWSGLGSDNDWFRPDNWLPIGQPGAGDSVRLDSGMNALLTNSTPLLSSFWMTNATLTVSNWNTAIRAEAVTIDNGAVLTLPAAFTNGGMSNRIYVTCGNFSLLSGGVLDADGRGYAGANGPSGAGASARLSGAGYGGRGSANPSYGDSLYGIAYGTPGGPLQPGSGGCGTDTGGAGGGLVQVEATNAIAIRGAIRANGNTGLPVRYFGPGGGSGGGVYLSCRSFTGSASGSISVRGGSGVKEKVSSPAGRGGGGRVAIVYESASPWPAVAIDADVGLSGAVTEPYGDSHTAQWGSLFVSDGSLLEGLTAINPGTFAVSNVVVWINGVTELNRASLTVSNAAFRFGATNLLLKIEGPLLVGAAGRLSASRIEAGSVTLTNGGILEIRAGATNGVKGNWGGGLDASGDLYIASNAVLRLYADPLSGGAPRIRVKNLTVAAGGLVDANAKGYKSARGPGAGGTGTRRRGGGYGGQGANGATSDPTGGLPYGSTNGLLQAGSGGCYDGRGGDGGGLAHFEVAGDMVLRGSITAAGGSALDYDDGQAGGGSGGGVFLACRTFTGGPGATISAQGGPGRVNAGGGGGGRIVLWTSITAQRFQTFWAKALNGETFPTAIISTNTLPAAFSGSFTNTILLTGGGPDTRTGESGTYRWMTVREGTVITVR